MKYWLLGFTALAVGLGVGSSDDAWAKKKKKKGATTTATAAKVVPPVVISEKDKAYCKEAHPQLLAEFGGEFADPKLRTYLDKVGQRIGNATNVQGGAASFKVTLLNSPVNNAFAIPGGCTYFTRQLIGLMNNEAELASVVGHEMGHIEAKHSKKRSSRATWGGIGTILATVAGGVLLGSEGAKLGQQLGGTIASGLILKYSRSQEFEADDFGVAYLNKAGYDTLGASTMLASLAQQTALDMKRAGKSDKALPEWASTHPDPASRVTRAAEKAKTVGGIGRDHHSDAFLSAINGVLYDDDPKQGIVDGQSFRHPDLKVTFTAPSGYALNNGADAVVMDGTGGRASFMGGTYSGDMNAFVASIFKKIGGSTTLNYGSVTKTTINGLPAGYATATAQTEAGSQVRVTVYGYEFGASDAYAIASITPFTSTDPFPSLYQSVKKLTDAEIKAIRPRKIEVVTVKSSDTVESLAAKMAYGDYKVERFRVLNALAAAQTLKSGQKVKIIVYN